MTAGVVGRRRSWQPWAARRRGVVATRRGRMGGVPAADEGRRQRGGGLAAVAATTERRRPSTTTQRREQPRDAVAAAHRPRHPVRPRTMRLQHRSAPIGARRRQDLRHRQPPTAGQIRRLTRSRTTCVDGAWRSRFGRHVAAARRGRARGVVLAQRPSVPSWPCIVAALAELRFPQVAELLVGAIDPRAADRRHRAARPPPAPRHRPGVATEVAEATVAERGDEVDAWLLPPLAYSKSERARLGPRHDLALGHRPSSAVLDDLGRCAAMTPARRLVLFNGHGGNSALLGVALRELRLPPRPAHVPRPSRACLADQGGGSTAPRSWAWASTAAPTRRR